MFTDACIKYIEKYLQVSFNYPVGEKFGLFFEKYPLGLLLQHESFLNFYDEDAVRRAKLNLVRFFSLEWLQARLNELNAPDMITIRGSRAVTR